GAVRAVVVGRHPGAAARGDLPARVVPPEHLRLRVLGPADHRRADGGGCAPPRPAHAVRAGRAANGRAEATPRPPVDVPVAVPATGPGAALVRTASLPEAATVGADPSHRVDPSAPGGRRRL